MMNKDLNAALEERCNSIISLRKKSFEESKELAFRIWKEILNGHKSFNETTIIVVKSEPFFTSKDSYFDLICKNYSKGYKSFPGFSDESKDYDVFDVLRIIATHNQIKCETELIKYHSFPAIQFTFH